MGKRPEIEDGDDDKERFGPVLRLTALAATLLAFGAVIGPRLASSGGGGSSDSSSTAAASLPAATTTSAPITSTSLPAAVTTTFPTVATTTTFPAASPTTTAPLVVPPEDPDTGAVELALIGVHAGRYGAEQSGFVAGNTIGWHLRVTNAGGEYLWGVFVYLETYGEVVCSERRLDVGESADCWAETTALAGSNEAEGPVTAWTDTRMVTDRISHRVAAVAG